MSQKMENLLNLALDATLEERMRSEELEVGYDPGENEWELILKFSGDLENITADHSVGRGAVKRLCSRFGERRKN